MGARLALPVIHLDALHWRPGWVAPARAEWERLVEDIVAGERWIADGNYGGTMELRLSRADTVIYLDIPRAVCVWRALRRALHHRGRTRPDMAPGCPERVDAAFLWWIWTYSARRRPALLRRLAALPPACRVLHLRSDREVRAFVAGLCPGAGVEAATPTPLPYAD